jgi:hypothetical protein
MALELFGFRIGRTEKEEDNLNQRVPSFVEPSTEDAPFTTNYSGIGVGEYASGVVDFEGNMQSEAALITQYRRLSQQPDAERAIDDIVNEAIIIDDDKPPVTLILDDLDQPEKIKTKISEEFEHIMRMLNFKEVGYDIFRRWYIDGRLYYHKMIDIKNPGHGILELRYIDPRKIKKIREEIRDTNNYSSNVNGLLDRKYKEYYIYNHNGITSTSSNQALKISKDSIVFIHSGILNENNTIVLSHLHKAIKRANQLRWMEDSLVIYRATRAPERRIFYIDVGNMPKMKAEQHLRDMMVKHKNKLQYNISTGEIKDEKRFTTMMEDFWLPRREGGRGTQIDTLPGGDNLGNIEDVEYFKQQFYKALNVPISRLESDTGFNLGRATEISRDEVKFSKLIGRLRARFSGLFTDILGTQLMLKGITDKKGWKKIKNDLYYDFNKDNFFSELKWGEIMRDRFELLDRADGYVGRYVSIEWAKKNILQQSDNEIKEIQKQMDKEVDEGEDGMDDNFGAFSGRPDAPMEPELPPEDFEEKPDKKEKTDQNESFDHILEEAEYQGRKVKLNDPFRTPKGPKKFSVYTRNESGNIVKVNFGDPDMEIKRDDPDNRKSFRARHNCDDPGPKWKPRYWSCYQWRSDARVDS